MKTYDDIQLAGNMNVMIWGPPGCGKTALAGTFPGLLFADCDAEGLKVWKSKWYRKWFGVPDLIGWDSFSDPVNDAGLFIKAEGFWNAMSFFNEHADDEGVATLVVDSLSGMQELAMHVGYELSGQYNRSKSLATVKDVRTGKAKAGAIPVILPTQADFGSEMEVFKQFMDQLVTIPGKNVVCVAHERAEYTSNGAMRSKGPLLTGQKIRALVAKWFDEVWYLDVNREGKRVLVTQPNGLIEVVKTRSDVPSGLVDPTYQKIMEAIK